MQQLQITIITFLHKPVFQAKALIQTGTNHETLCQHLGLWPKPCTLGGVTDT